MRNQYRTLIVMTIAVLTAGLASLFVYRAIQRIPVREVEVASMHIVVAAQPLPVGPPNNENQLEVVAWPSRNPVAGAFTDPKKVIDRGVISTILENETITG